MRTPLEIAITEADGAATRALDCWGRDAQIAKAIEEMGELLLALGRTQYQAAAGDQQRADLPNLVEECGDVIVTMLALARAHDAGRDNLTLAQHIENKAKRLHKRVWASQVNRGELSFAAEEQAP